MWLNAVCIAQYCCFSLFLHLCSGSCPCCSGGKKRIVHRDVTAFTGKEVFPVWPLTSSLVSKWFFDVWESPKKFFWIQRTYCKCVVCKLKIILEKREKNALCFLLTSVFLTLHPQSDLFCSLSWSIFFCIPRFHFLHLYYILFYVHM